MARPRRPQPHTRRPNTPRPAKPPPAPFGPPRSPHDTLVKSVLAKPEDAAALLRTVLPAELSVDIDWAHFERRDTEIPNEERSPTRTDLLFETRIRGADARVYVVFEHQSTPDALMPLRLARTVVGILHTAASVSGRGKGRPRVALPIVLPIVFAHTPGGWRTHRSLADLVPIEALQPEFRRSLLQIEPVLVDLTGAQHDELLRWVQTLTQAAAVPQAIMLRLLVVTRRTQPRDRDAARTAILALLPEIAPLFAYLLRTRDPLLADLERYTIHVGRVTPREIQQRLAEALEEDAMPTMTLRELYIQELEAAGRERWLEEGQRVGLAKGIAQGMERGIEQGIGQGIEQGELARARRTLTRQLEKKFGGLGPYLRSRINEATLEVLDAALDRVLEATSPDDVFEA